MDSQLIWYLIGFLTTFLTIVVFVLSVSYYKLVTQIEALRKQQAADHDQNWKKGAQLLEDARHQSMEMVEQAEHKAEAIIAETKFFTTAAKALMTDKLKGVSKDQAGAYIKMLESVRAEMSEIVKELASELQIQAKQELTQFREDMEKMLSKAEETLQVQVKTEADKANLSFTEQEQKAWAQLEEKVQAAVKELTSQVVGKSLSERDHQTLIMQALEEAKQQHVF